MDFVPVPFYYDYTSVLLKRPDPSDTKWRTLLDPFLKEIYICIACTFVIVTVLIYIIERNSESAPSKTTDGEENTIDHVFLYLLASLFTEGKHCVFLCKIGMQIYLLFDRPACSGCVRV